MRLEVVVIARASGIGSSEWGAAEPVGGTNGAFFKSFIRAFQ
jgi:hypothetical protein